MSAKPPTPDVQTLTLDVNLLGRGYKVSCKEGEEEELREAIELLDQRMRNIRDGSKTSSVEKIAVMAALNLAHELQSARTSAHTERATIPERTAVTSPQIIDAPAARRRIASMRSAIDQVLSGQDKLL